MLCLREWKSEGKGEVDHRKFFQQVWLYRKRERPLEWSLEGDVECRSLPLKGES